MTSKCLLLFQTQLRNELGHKRTSKGSNMAVFGLIIIIIMIGAYSYSLSYGLGSLGMAEVIPSYGVALTGLITLFFTALKTNGVLFAYKEYDMLMSLPVKTSSVIASRFLTMYTLNLALSAVVLIPMGAGYVYWMKPGILFYFTWLAGIIAAPMIPTTLAAVLGTLIILFSYRFKYANAVVTILSLTATVAVLFGSFSFANMGEQGQIDLSQIRSLGEFMLVQIHKIYPPAILFHRCIAENIILDFMIFIILSFGWYFIFVQLVSTIYKKLNTALTTFHSKSNYKLTELKSSTQVTALYRKELKRFFSSTIYCLNMGIGSIMTIVVAVACLFLSKEKLLETLGLPVAWEILLRVMPFAIGALISLSCTTCISLSMEGKNLWIIKTLPLEDITIYKSKILMNLTLQIPAALIAAVIVNIKFPLSPVMRMMTFLTPLVCACFNSVYGMLINLKLPVYEWTSETALVKQSLPSMLGMLGGLFGGFIPVGILIVFRGVSSELLTVTLTGLIAAGALLMWSYVKKLKI